MVAVGCDCARAKAYTSSGQYVSTTSFRRCCYEKDGAGAVEESFCLSSASNDTFHFFFLFFPRLLYFRERPPRTPSPVSSPGMHERAVRKGVDAHTTASMRETDRLLTSRNGEESQQQHQQRRPAIHHPYVRSERAPCYKGAHRRWRGHPSSQHARSVTPLLLTARTCLQSLPGMMTSALSFDPHFFDPHPPKKRR